MSSNLRNSHIEFYIPSSNLRKNVKTRLLYNMRVSILMNLLGTMHVAFSKPTQPPISNISTLPVHFGVLLFPGFQFLDAFGAIDVLSTLRPNRQTTHSMISLNVSLDTLAAEYNLHEHMHFDVIGETNAPISTILNISASNFGQLVVVTTTFDEVIASQKTLDVLIIPGGYGTRAAIPAAAPFIKAVYPRVCLSPSSV